MNAQLFFEQIQNAWQPYLQTSVGSKCRLIPFCTPVVESPTALVIGTNHSDFVQGGGKEAEKIAAEFEAALPKINTYIHHNHKFSNGLKKVCELAGIEVTEKWVGTNRCALQTGPDGIEHLKKEPNFIHCQITMDQILRKLIEEIRPKNVILTGKYAIGLYYPSHLKFDALQPFQINCSGQRVNLIPIQHPSRARFWKEAADRLQTNFQE